MHLFRLSQWTWRTRLLVYGTGLTFITLAPIATAARVVNHQADLPGATPQPPDRGAAYRAHRNPIVDRLLPEGAAGTRVVADLGGNRGDANGVTTAIRLAEVVANEPWPESVELHERAHLVDAFLPAIVARLMARMPAPAAGEIAADDRAQHFAEMAANAWEVLLDPEGMCLDGTPAQRLADAETRVPGTAGFVLWYLREPAFQSVDGRAELRALAERLTAAARREWDDLFTAIEGHRLAGGSFAPWRYQSVRDHITRQRAGLAAGGWLGRIASAVYWPSLAALKIAGQ